MPINRRGYEYTPAEPRLPSIARQATGFVRSAVAVVATSGARVTPEVQSARLTACEACDHYRPSDGRCGMATGCGCYVARKAPFAAAVCPVNRWPVVTQSETECKASHPPGMASGETTGPESQG